MTIVRPITRADSTRWQEWAFRRIGRHTELCLNMQLGGPKTRLIQGLIPKTAACEFDLAPFKAMLSGRFGKKSPNFVMRLHLIACQRSSHSLRGWKGGGGARSAKQVVRTWRTFAKASSGHSLVAMPGHER
jgi:hypothetical protein